MSHAYTPGLRVAARTTIRKHRILPIAGQVLVCEGDRVRAEDAVARAELPGPVSTVNVVSHLGIAPAEIKGYMLKREGDSVQEGEIIAETRPWLKWLKTVARSPARGTIETVSGITGQVLVRRPPRPIEVRAYIDGVVVEVAEKEGATVETHGALVQGIFGVGGEVAGQLAMACNAPDETASPESIGSDMAGRIVVAGELVTADLYRRARQAGVAALICGGVNDSDLRDLLGYDIGVAITGQEAIRPILIVTEGFGRIAMAGATFDLLRSNAGRRASANGATQIRAGVLRPEIVIPCDTSGPPSQLQQEQTAAAGGLMKGAPVRIIRAPGFGRIGRVKSLPAGVVQIETEARVRVLEVEFDDGKTAIVPRANVEVIEEQ